MPRRVLVLPVVAFATLMAYAAAAQEAPSATDTDPLTFTLRTSIKAGALLFRNPDDAGTTDRAGGESVWRVRFEPHIGIGTRVAVDVAYEHRLRFGLGSAGETLTGVLPPEADVPYRATPLAWHITDAVNSSWRHEIDRANVRVQLPRAELTVGRQAIGWGRGVMFGAVDLFAPFQPLEADREWRPGVDAVRADMKMTDRSSADLVVAAGPRWDRSVIAARVRGYAGRADVELMGGRRAGDLFAGATSSAAVGDAEIHSELAAFRVPVTSVATGHVVWKAVAGGSYQFPVGNGLLMYAEYHYSGFGATSPEAILQLLADPSFAERYVRGDTQILSRHAVGTLASYEWSPLLTLSGQWLLNPLDRSGIGAPAVTLTFSDQLSLFASMYVPYGRGLRAGVLRSEYGAAPLTGYVQLRLYM